MMGEDGGLCESQVIVDYLESRYPQHPLIPADPFQAAKVREIITFLELHLEWWRANCMPKRSSAARSAMASRPRCASNCRRTFPPRPGC